VATYFRRLRRWLRIHLFGSNIRAGEFGEWRWEDNDDERAG
jgi:hypothetical protein